MKFIDQKKRVASYINYLTDSNNIVEGREVTETDIGNWLNDRYLEDVFPGYADKNNDYYSQDAYTQTYFSDAIADASSTGTTLVATTGVFSAGMVGCQLYNEDDTEYAIIETYINSTTVELKETPANSWAGDTFYIFTGTYSFGGEVSPDIYQVVWVGIKYSETQEDYTRCQIMLDTDFNQHKRGPDNRRGVTSQINPIYMYDTIDFASSPISAIQIRPIPDKVLEQGVYMKYIERPQPMVNDTDEPRLPRAHHKVLIYGATADAFRKLMEFDKAEVYEREYQKAYHALIRSFKAERIQRELKFVTQTQHFYTLNNVPNNGRQFGRNISNNN